MAAQFRQRMPDDLHARAKALAEKLGMSLNSFINMAVHDKTLDIDELEKRVSEIEKTVFGDEQEK